MNYLAHAYLSGNDENLLVGNFIADHLRGNDFSNYSFEIIEGIKMHRAIDTFTDSHTLFKESKRIFYDGFEKHSGILVDIYFDYLLAKNFNQFHSESLQVFSDKVYNSYQKNRMHLPESSNRFLEYVIKNNIYYSYSKIEGIEKVLFHLSHRIKHNVQLNDSVSIFLKKENEIEKNFVTFFEECRKEFLV